MQNKLSEQDYEFIGPLEGWLEECLFSPVWVSLSGLNHDNANGSSRKKACEKLKKGDIVFLFWDKKNPYDECAVGVFTEDNIHSANFLNSQIGYIPRDVSGSCISSFTGTGSRISAEVMSVYNASSSGYTDVKVELVEFLSEEMIQEFEKKHEADCEQWRDNNFEKFLAHCLFLNSDIVKAICNAGYNSKDRLEGASDSELLKIHGVGNKTLEKLRLAFPLKNKDSQEAVITS